MKLEEKEKRLKGIIAMTTENELKQMCFESFLDGLEKGMKIKDIKTEKEQQSA